MSKNPRLFDLLPSYLRATRNRRGGTPIAENHVLEALLAEFDRELGRLEEVIDASYDDFFLETCRPEMIPYVADLIGYSIPPSLGARARKTEREYGVRLRRDAAAAIELRRAKGTLAVLAEGFTSLTGWHSVVHENGRRVLMTPSIRRGELVEGRSVPNIRRASLPDRTSMGRAATLSSVGSHGVRRHWYPTDVVVETWSRRAYLFDRVTAGRLGRYLTFNPLGIKTRLYMPADHDFGTHKTVRPAPTLSSARRIRLGDFERAADMTESLFAADGVVGIFTGARPKLVSGARFAPLDDDVQPDEDWIIDPEQGLALHPRRWIEGPVLMRGYYEFGGDIGGGAYRKPASGLKQNRPETALALPEPKDGVIGLTDSQTYHWNLPPGGIPATYGQRLVISAVPGCRPTVVIRGRLHTARLREITLEGVVLVCQSVAGTALERIALSDAVLVSAADGRAVPASISVGRTGSPELSINIERSVVGSIRSRCPALVCLDEAIIQAGPHLPALEGDIELAGRCATIVQDDDVGFTARTTNLTESIFPGSSVGGPGFAYLVFGRDGYLQPDIGPLSQLSLAPEPGAFHAASPALSLLGGILRLKEFAPMDVAVGVVLRE